MTRRFLPPVPRPIGGFLSLALVLALLNGQASAQTPVPSPSRESLLDAERVQKAATLKAPERSFVERWLYKYDQQTTTSVLPIFGSWHGLHLAGGGFPPGAGMKFGVGYNQVIGRPELDEPNRLEVFSSGAYGTRGYKRIAAGLDFRNIGGAPIGLRVNGQRYEHPQEDYFGAGAESRSEDRTSYLVESTDLDVDVFWMPVRVIEIGGGAGYLKPETGSGTDSRYPSIETLFPVSSLPGFGVGTDFLRTDVSAAVDWRDNPLHPHGGGRYGVKFSNFSDLDSDGLAFRRVEIDLQQYVGLPSRYRTLALRAAAVLTDTDAGRDVPFYLQPTLGGAQALRGFREFRFRDRNSMVLSAEYRWEAWWALDAAFFVDAGMVAADRRDFNLRDLDVSYGVGFRLHSNRAFVARLDLARSREGFLPMLRFEHAF